MLLVTGLVMGEAVERSARFTHRRRDDRRSVTAEPLDTLQLKHCRFDLPPFLTELPRLDRDGAVATGTRLPAEGVDLRVTGPNGTIGRFVLKPTPSTAVSPERLLVAVSLAHALGLALAMTGS
jgi:hypothetical protein